jgi:hypothetical protein
MTEGWPEAARRRGDDPAAEHLLRAWRAEIDEERAVRREEPGLRPRTRHVHILDAERVAVRQGFVIEWSRYDDGWRALVLYVVEGEGGHRAVQEWLDAQVLSPVVTDAPPDRAARKPATYD